MKNRLIGILVLLLIVYIGSPIIFGTEEKIAVDLTSQIDEFESEEVFTEPKIPDFDLFEEDNIKESENAIKSNKRPEKKSPKTKPDQYSIEVIDASPKLTAKSSVDKQGIPISWVLQLASFQEDERAQNLLSKLHDKGFKAYTKKVSTKVGLRIRVYAGPSLDKDDLIKTQQKIDKLFKLKSLLIRFTPNA